MTTKKKIAIACIAVVVIAAIVAAVMLLGRGGAAPPALGMGAGRGRHCLRAVRGGDGSHLIIVK